MSEKCPICNEEGGHLVGCEWPYMVESNYHLTKGTVRLCRKIAYLEARLLRLERVREAAENLVDATIIGTEGWEDARFLLAEALDAIVMEIPDA